MINPKVLGDALSGFYGNMPHPDVPGGAVTLNEYDAYARAAARMNENPKPTPEQIAHTHEALTQAQLSPAEFERIWDMAKPLANQLLDRQPQMTELAMLAGAHPGEVVDYYRNSPHPNYPHISAGEMADMHHSAAAISLEHAGRWPSEADLATFVTGNYDGQAIADYYRKSKR